MQTQSVPFKNSTLFYRATGIGPFVVLLHGFGEDGNIWQSQIDFLKPHFRIIIPDIPGSGKSPLINDADIDTYAEAVKLILDDQIKRSPDHQKDGFALIGHSLGGYIALAFAEKYPQYLKQLGLIHSTAFEDTKEKKEVRRKSIEFIKAKSAVAFLRTTIPGLFGKSFASKKNEKILNLVDQAKEFSGAALIQYYEAMIARPDRTAVLKSFDGKILFIVGEHDTAIPLQSSLQQCYLPLRSYVHILNQSAHMGMWEEEEKVNTILLNFLVNKF
jgi:pimeloyl-ACP methyl ester carboxylesterase